MTPAVMLFTRRGSDSSADRYDDQTSSKPAKLLRLVDVVGRGLVLALMNQDVLVRPRRLEVVLACDDDVEKAATPNDRYWWVTMAFPPPRTRRIDASNNEYVIIMVVVDELWLD